MTFRLLRLLLVATLSLGAGCVSAETIAVDSAVDRAAAEFQCAPERVVVSARPELSARTFDVEACGHKVRYTCLTGNATAYASDRTRVACTREPAGPADAVTATPTPATAPTLVPMPAPPATSAPPTPVSTATPAPTSTTTAPAPTPTTSNAAPAAPDDVHCTDPKPGPDWTCVRNCGAPVVRPDSPDPGWSWLAPPAKRRNCPVCLPESARIATPTGYVLARDAVEGMAVWTLNRRGQRVAGTIVRTGSTHAPPEHRILRVTLADGREVEASGGHPTADGRTFGDLRRGDEMDGSRVVGVLAEPYGSGRTFDILPSGETGAYWANDVLIGSTLR